MGCNTSTTDNVKDGKTKEKGDGSKKAIKKVNSSSGEGKCESVEVPELMNKIFRNAEDYIQDFFNGLEWNPKKAEIKVKNDRFVLARGSSLTVELYKLMCIKLPTEAEGEDFYRNFLFELSHNMGKCDCEKTFEKNKEVDAIKRLSCGPVYFSFTGWARVRLLPGCVPSTDPEKYLLFYDHPYSFEAFAFKKAGIKVKRPICVMSSGYSSGWCSVSFGIPLVAFELTCIARGDPTCTFVMGHPDHLFKKINEMKEKGALNRVKDVMDNPVELPGLLNKNLSVSKKKKKSDGGVEDLLMERKDVSVGSISFSSYQNYVKKFGLKKAVSILHHVFYKIDEVLESNKEVEKIGVSGFNYVIASNLNADVPDHKEKMLKVCKIIEEEISSLEISSELLEDDETEGETNEVTIKIEEKESVQIGVHTGPVVSSKVPGNVNVYGEAYEVAKSLQEKSSNGRILASSAFEGLSGFEFENSEKVNVVGYGEIPSMFVK